MATGIISQSTQKSVIQDTAPGDMFSGLPRHKLINEPSAARILSFKTDTLRKMRKAGRGPTFVRLGRSILYRLPDIERFILDHMCKPEPNGAV